MKVYMSAGGSLTRGAEQDRIDFLAQARNRALEPLWLTTDQADLAASSRRNTHDARDDNAHATWHMLTSAKDNSRSIWPAQKVAFLNDVFFCAQDIIRYKRDSTAICIILKQCCIIAYSERLSLSIMQDALSKLDCECLAFLDIAIVFYIVQLMTSTIPDGKLSNAV